MVAFLYRREKAHFHEENETSFWFSLTLPLKESGLTHQFVIVGSIFYYCSIMYKNWTPDKQSNTSQGQRSSLLVTANKVKEVSEQRASSWCVAFCYFTGVAISWIASLFPWRSCDIWLESLLEVPACLFSESFEVFSAQWNCINSSCDTSDAFFFFRIQKKGVSFHLEIFWLTLCLSLQGEWWAKDRIHIFLSFVFYLKTLFCFSSECYKDIELSSSSSLCFFFFFLHNL